jgi:hypothetical protein
MTPTPAVVAVVATVGAVFAALYAAHQVADHFVQTQHQADLKGRPGLVGRWHCAAHVATYTLTAVVALLALVWRTGLPLSLAATVAGLAVSAVSHYIADRRTPLRRLADWLGKDPGWLERGGGLYALDQAWHVGWLFVAALVIGGH